MAGVSLLWNQQLKRLVSSSSTFFGKFFFSAIFIVATIFVTFNLIVWPIISRQHISWSSIVFAIFWTAIALSCCCLVTIPLKVVSVDEGELYISNFFKEIAVPLSEVEHIEELNEFGFKLILICLKSPTKFGQRIKFLPDTRFRSGKEQSVFEELKGLTTVSRR